MASNSKITLLDTGALLAFLSRDDRYHLMAVAAFKGLPRTLITCEAVISEVCFLLQRNRQRVEPIASLLRERVVTLISLAEELDSIFSLMAHYADVPMSFADASLVRLAEIQPRSVIVTTDSDFTVYRMKRNQKLPIVLIK